MSLLPISLFGSSIWGQEKKGGLSPGPSTCQGDTRPVEPAGSPPHLQVFPDLGLATLAEAVRGKEKGVGAGRGAGQCGEGGGLMMTLPGAAAPSKGALPALPARPLLAREWSIAGVRRRCCLPGQRDPLYLRAGRTRRAAALPGRRPSARKGGAPKAKELRRAAAEEAGYYKGCGRRGGRTTAGCRLRAARRVGRQAGRQAAGQKARRGVPVAAEGRWR